MLRRLWCEPSVTHHGRTDTVRGAGIAPAPRQRPIPIWFGGSSAPAYRRAGRLADGWFPQMAPGAELEEARALVAASARAAGRDPAAIKMEGRVPLRAERFDEALEAVAAWEASGASHCCLNTMGGGLSSLDEHLELLARAAEALRLPEGSSRAS